MKPLRRPLLSLLDASGQTRWRVAAAMHIVILTWCNIFCLESYVANAATYQLDDFQSGTLEGWSGALSLTLENNGGPDGTGDAFLHVTSTGGIGPGSHLAAYNGDSNWIGDLDALGAAFVEVDLMCPEDSVPLEMRLVLFGPVADPENLNNRWTSSTAAAVPNDGIWRTYSFSLAEVDLTRVGISATYDAMIADVLRVMLRHDAISPSFGGTPVAAELGVDNLRYVPAVVLGDMNQDGNLTSEDVALFVEALTNPLAYAARALPLPAETVGDVNQDGRFDLADNSSFSALFVSPTTSATEPVPEVSTIAMAVLVLLFHVLHTRR